MRAFKAFTNKYEMGCLCAKNKDESFLNESPERTKKGYSWEKKETVNPKNFMVENVLDSTVVRIPGSVKGQQFIIQNCSNSNIFILDHINTASVDDCHNCNIFLGPTKGSVFLRDCRECRFLIAAQQFRARDCKLVDTFLCCPTQPIIESCSDMRFGCFSFYYEELEQQFRNSDLSIFNNNWSDIHDFTPSDEEQNWSLFPKTAIVEEFFTVPTKDVLNGVEAILDPAQSTVPQTYGCHQKIGYQSCLVVFFCDGNSQARTLCFIKEMELTDIILVRSKQLLINALDSQRIFGTDSYDNLINRGPVIALEYNGHDCLMRCQETAKAIITEAGCTGLIYVSNSSKAANRQVENLFACRDMQMSK